MKLDFKVRPAEPSDAEALVLLAEAVTAEPEGWLISANGEWRSVADEAALKGCKTDKCKVVFRTGPKICGAIALTADDKVWGARHEITALLPSWPQSRTARNAARVSARFALQSVIGTLPVFLRSR